MQPSRISVALERGRRARGFAYAAVPADVDARLNAWIDSGRVDEGAVLKPGRAYRLGAWMIKFSGAGGVRDYLRASPALKSARAHFSLLPVRTPRPLVALEWRSFLHLEGSLLVSEFVEGALLSEVWDRDPRAMQAFPGFMALLHTRPLMHGDFHPYNVLWDGAEWVLIDLDSVRHRLHTLRRRNLVEMQWARVLRGLAFDDSVRPAFDEYLRLTGFGWPADRTWLAISTRARAMPPIAAEHQWVSSQKRITHGA